MRPIDKTNKTKCSRCQCYKFESNIKSMKSGRIITICIRCQIQKRNYRLEKKLLSDNFELDQPNPPAKI